MNLPINSSPCFYKENKVFYKKQISNLVFGDDFDFNGTSRKEYENEYYKRVCSEIIDGFLYFMIFNLNIYTQFYQNTSSITKIFIKLKIYQKFNKS